jgi:hypothetical protein
MAEEPTKTVSELVEEGADNNGVTLTKEQCAELVEYFQERFDEGYGCGVNVGSAFGYSYE